MKVSHLVVAALASVMVSPPASTLVLSPQLVVFSGLAGRSNPPAQSVRVTTSGTTASAWRVAGQQAPWLAITPKSGSAPDSMNLVANISGMRAGTYADTVRITSSNLTATQLIPVFLVVTSVPPSVTNLSTYEIEVSYKGFLGIDDTPECIVNRQGYDRLAGTVTGAETTGSDQDVVYYGALRRETAIDFCETRGKKTPDDAERVWCAASLVGYGVMQVELTVHRDEETGGYLKAAVPAGGPMMRGVSGRCDPPEQKIILSNYQTASDGGAASPNGQPIDDAKAVDAGGRRITFVAGGAPRLRVGTYPPTGPEDGWTLRVIRKIQ